MYFWERKNGIRDSDEKSAGCGILVKKEGECGIRTPPSRPWLYKALIMVSYSRIHYLYSGAGNNI